MESQGNGLEKATEPTKRKVASQVLLPCIAKSLSPKTKRAMSAR